MTTDKWVYHIGYTAGGAYGVIESFGGKFDSQSFVAPVADSPESLLDNLQQMWDETRASIDRGEDYMVSEVA